MNTMTAEQAFNVAMNQYPTLYSSKTKEDALFKYYDHIFNTIGNGYNTLEVFLKKHSITEENKNDIHHFPEKYIGEIDLYYGYTEVEKFGSTPEDTFFFPKHDSMIKGLFTEDEKAQHKDVLYWIKNSNTEIAPYPNFSKQYSMVWRYDLTKLDDSWINASIFYYNRAKKFFNSEEVYSYHNALPKEKENRKEFIEIYANILKNYRENTETEEKFLSEVEKHFKVPYDDNIENFVEKCWDKNLKDINDFIDETLIHLDETLKIKLNKTKKLKF